MKCCEKCGISTAEEISFPNKAHQDDTANDHLEYNNNKKGQSSNNGGDIGRSNLNYSLRSKYKLKSLELDSSLVIARKLSGRYIVKKKESTISLNTTANKSMTTTNSTVGNCIIADSVSSSFLKDDGVRASDEEAKELENLCHICYLSEFNGDEQFYQILCGHKFCKPCWESYLTLKIEEGNVNDIVCPQVDCFAIIPHQVVESLVSKETAQKYLHFDIKVMLFIFQLSSLS
jgi:hypothetical protein